MKATNLLRQLREAALENGASPNDAVILKVDHALKTGRGINTSLRDLVGAAMENGATRDDPLIATCLDSI